MKPIDLLIPEPAMKNLIQNIGACLAAGQDLVLATPSSQSDSIPRLASSFANLEHGVSERRLQRVRPIGLAIEAGSPEMIAVSIVGALIRRRASGRKT